MARVAGAHWVPEGAKVPAQPNHTDGKVRRQRVRYWVASQEFWTEAYTGQEALMVWAELRRVPGVMVAPVLYWEEAQEAAAELAEAA